MTRAEGRPRSPGGAGASTLPKRNAASDVNYELKDFPEPLAGEVSALVQRHGLGGGAILPVLEAIRRGRGIISDASFRIAARALGVRPADLKELAVRSGRFPVERHPARSIVVCVNEHCRRRGAHALLEAIREATGLEPGRTGPGNLSVETVCCLGACDFGPNVLVDGWCYHEVDPAGMRRILEALSAPAVPVQSSV